MEYNDFLVGVAARLETLGHVCEVKNDELFVNKIPIGFNWDTRQKWKPVKKGGEQVLVTVYSCRFRTTIIARDISDETALVSRAAVAIQNALPDLTENFASDQRQRKENQRILDMRNAIYGDIQPTGYANVFKDGGIGVIQIAGKYRFRMDINYAEQAALEEWARQKLAIVREWVNELNEMGVSVDQS